MFRHGSVVPWHEATKARSGPGGFSRGLALPYPSWAITRAAAFRLNTAVPSALGGEVVFVGSTGRRWARSVGLLTAQPAVAAPISTARAHTGTAAMSRAPRWRSMTTPVRLPFDFHTIRTSPYDGRMSGPRQRS